MNIEKDFNLSYDHSEVVIFLASILHDLGMSISREGHEEFSIFLTNNLLHQILDFLPIKEKTIVISEVLHAIIAHRSGGIPYTLEAGIVRVSDALDMSEGRTRIPYESGKVDIYSMSATAVNNVRIESGKVKAIRIVIEMNNSAGVFQVDELLRKKIKGSGIEKYVEIEAYVNEEERKLVKEFILKDF